MAILRNWLEEVAGTERRLDEFKFVESVLLASEPGLALNDSRKLEARKVSILRNCHPLLFALWPTYSLMVTKQVLEVIDTHQLDPVYIFAHTSRTMSLARLIQQASRLDLCAAYELLIMGLTCGIPIIRDKSAGCLAYWSAPDLSAWLVASLFRNVLEGQPNEASRHILQRLIELRDPASHSSLLAIRTRTSGNSTLDQAVEATGTLARR